MLQQTQVSRVVPAYERFLDRFPTVARCAAAAPADVVRAWAGLGYNRRAVNLHAAACSMDGTVPDSYEKLIALPGIGPYTANAVLAFAYERDVAPVDTNVARVLARQAGTRLAGAAARQLAESLVPEGRGWEWNQAMFDLGAEICRKRDPACSACPVQGSCAWANRGAPDPAVASTQPRFDGSDRQGRGRLVAALRAGTLRLEQVPAAAGWDDDPDRAARVLDGLVADGLAAIDAGEVSLPG